MQQIKQMIWVAVLALFSASSFADFYIGGGLYQSQVDDTQEGVSIDGDKTTIGVMAGYKPVDYFAIEVGHYDLGSYGPSDNNLDMEVSASGPALGVNAILPMKLFDVYAKAGMIFITWTGGEDKSTDTYYGLGTNFNLGSALDIYLEYLLIDADFQAEMIGAGVRVNF